MENGLHWILDVAFREVKCRIRKGYATENFSRLLTSVCLESVQQGENQERPEPATQTQALRPKYAVSAQNPAGVNLHAIALSYPLVQ